MFKFPNIPNVDSLVLPYLQSLVLEGFPNSDIKYLSFRNEECQLSFDNFANTLISSIGKKYLPIVRLSDGEYLFLLGEKPPSRRNQLYIIFFLKYIKFLFRKILKNNFVANTLPGVSSGSYSKSELNASHKNIVSILRDISNSGYLALHLTYAEKPFQEKFHKDLFELFKLSDIDLNSNNYVPFYFIYALFTFPKYRQSLFWGKDILLINSFDDSKKSRIEKTLFSFGCNTLQWINLSNSRSLYDILPNLNYINNLDLILIGAGVGKFNIFNQLNKLNLLIPVVDVGVLFELWADGNLSCTRPFIYNENIIYTTRN